MSAMPAEQQMVELRRGSLYLSGGIYDRYFQGLASVILLRKGDDLLVMPVRHAAGGGYLLKVRNSAGDRVINAVDFFLDHGLGDDTDVQLPVAWSSEDAALRAPEAFKVQTKFAL